MAPAEDDVSIDEKRVYAGGAGRTDAYVATGTGVVRVALSADKIGAFELVDDDPARDVAVLARDSGPDRVAAATPDGLAVAGDDPAFESVDDDPAAAVGAAADGDAFLVARGSGAIDRVAAVDRGRAADRDAVADRTAAADQEPASATRLGSVAEPRAVDGGLVAAADGVHRVDDGAVRSVGLDDARDVVGTGTPLAATGSGLYRLGNGWMTAREGAATAVAADGDGRAAAVVDGDLLVHSGVERWGGETWERASVPVDETVVALGYGPGVLVAVTDGGTLCVNAGDGWRYQVIGVRDVAGVALAVMV